MLLKKHIKLKGNYSSVGTEIWQLCNIDDSHGVQWLYQSSSFKRFPHRPFYYL